MQIELGDEFSHSLTLEQTPSRRFAPTMALLTSALCVLLYIKRLQYKH